MIKTFGKGGIHPPQHKDTAGTPLLTLPLPKELRIMLAQSIGAASHAVVKPGDRLEPGSLIAQANAFVGADIFSPVSGTVKKIEPSRTPQGLWQESVIVAVDEEQPVLSQVPESREAIDALSPSDIIAKVKGAGIVGLGGAAFPTHVKLSVPPGRTIDTIIINGAECEPVLTCDDTLMRLHPSEILKGAELIMRATGAKRIVIGIEDNKPEAIEAMRNACSTFDNAEVAVLHTRYPQGGEKQMIKAITGRVIPSGGLPADVGCVVDNVATAYAIYEAIYLGIKLTRRIVTIDGDGIERPGNYVIANGTPLSFILEQTGWNSENTGKIIAGGPMMGRAVSTLDATTVKGLSGLITISEADTLRDKQGPCIRCARCVAACPMNLQPYLLMLQSENGLWEEMKEASAMSCIECGCCSYTCPSKRAILDYIKLGKQAIRKTK